MKRKVPGRKLAEWITLIVSSATILGLIAYLVMDIFTPASNHIELAATPVYGEAARAGNRFVLPIEIENRGGKTVAYASFSIAITGPDGKESETFELKYLAGNSKRRIYKYLPRDPKDVRIDLVPVYYTLE